MFARLLYSINTSNILCGGFLLEYFEIEGHKRNEFPFGACLRAAILCENIYTRDLLLCYLKIEHKEDLNKICRRSHDVCACGALWYIKYPLCGGLLLKYLEMNKTRLRSELRYKELIFALAGPYNILNILSRGLLLVSEYIAQNTGFQKEKGTRPCLALVS
jgi:hypothetical protein